MKRPLKSFDIKVIDGNVFVEIITDRRKPHRYRIWNDERHPNVDEIARHLHVGLSGASATFSKIGVGEYLERNYVLIELPIKYHSNQYSAAEF